MIKNWMRDNKGSVFVVVAFSVMAVVGAVGVAVDIGRSQMVQAKLQSAVDAAGLAAGASVNSADLEGVATKYINLNFNANNLGAQLDNIETTLSEDKKILTVSASASIPTTVTKIIGRSSVAVAAETEITRSNKGLEVALVLDTTGSMKGSKLTALKTASHDLVDILFGDEDTAENLWVGVVPFSQTVNIGASRTNWLLTTHPAAYNWFTSSWGGCVEARYSTGRDITDDPPFDLALPNAVTPAAPYQRLRAYYAPAEIWSIAGAVTNTQSVCSNKSSCTCGNYGPCSTWIATSINKATHTTCTGSGNKASCSRATRTFAINGETGPNAKCPSPITTLTNNKATVETGIDALVAQGNTHVNYGAVWGWRLISPRWRGYWGDMMNTNNLPLNYHAPLMSKAVIIMTDGENTTTTYSAYPSASGVDDIDMNTKTTQVCNAMKAQGIIVYTILFQEDSNTIKTLLRNCATNPDYFFDSPSEEALKSAFQTIGDSLANLRISK